jgi:hypothetical protein
LIRTVFEIDAFAPLAQHQHQRSDQITPSLIFRIEGASYGGRTSSWDVEDESGTFPQSPRMNFEALLSKKFAYRIGGATQVEEFRFIEKAIDDGQVLESVCECHHQKLDFSRRKVLEKHF